MKIVSIMIGILGVLLAPLSWAQSEFKPLAESGKLNDRLVEAMLVQSKTVDEFLAALQSNKKTEHYLERFIPIWESDSLQKSYTFCPRILMYNQDASFVMSIVGCPRLNHEQDDVEIVQWNEKELKFELYSVHYRLESQPVAKVEIGEKNPAECMRCHKGGISIGAFDPYTWAGSDLNYYSVNLAALYVNSITGDTAAYENRELLRQIKNISRYKYFKVAPLLDKYPYLRRQQYGSFLAQVQGTGDWELRDRQFTTSKTSVGFMQDTPVKKFNELLAEKNHRRTIQKAKEVFGDKYNELKYFLLSALSDCESFIRFVPANPEYAPPRSAQDAYEKLHGFYVRIGLNVMRPRIEESENVYQNIYAVKQLDSVAKVYYGMLSMDMDDQVRELNLNPIKFTMYPLWGTANIVEAMLAADPDFAELRQIDGISTGAYLRMRSGLPPGQNHALWNKWRDLAKKEKDAAPGASKSVLMDPGLQDQFSDRLDKLYFHDQKFIGYCQKIEEVYRAKFGQLPQ